MLRVVFPRMRRAGPFEASPSICRFCAGNRDASGAIPPPGGRPLIAARRNRGNYEASTFPLRLACRQPAAAIAALRGATPRDLEGHRLRKRAFL